jgi:poly(A) polymerase
MFGREIVEVATFRGFGDGDDDARRVVDGRLVRDNVWGDIEEDARRRDFRVNALYYDIADFSVIDFVGGMEDLEQRRLHLIGDPELRYREDPVRMLRAARLAAKLGFAIDPTASAPFATLGHLLGEAPSARLFDETMKMFMAGHGLASFRMLEKCDLLKHLFAGTARALARDERGALRSLVENGLAGTDARVREDKPVTPAFLFAVLLWGEVYSIARGLQAEGVDRALAWQRAAHKVMAEQTERVAIPRRFSYAMEEIWALQPRFAERTKKRVFRLLAHPRFRAAYDFLLLRAAESDDLRERGEWWTRIQTLDPAQLEEALQGVARAPTQHPQHGGGESAEAAAPRKRRRRRGGRGRGKSKTGSASPADDSAAE